MDSSRTEPTIGASRADGRLAYPPVDPGIQVRAVDDILQPHADFIARIKLAYGADNETFLKDLYSLIERYARYVNLLPATADNYFSGPGGLFRMGLEIAFFSLQATDGQIFSGRSTITNRRQLEPRWRHATFIAGLCSEIHRTLSHVVVTDEKGNEWPPYLMPLSDWLQQHRVSRFFLRWVSNAEETRSLGVFALPHIIPHATMHYLAQENAIVVPHMMAAISGMPTYREHNIVDQLVRRASALVIDRDLQTSADRYGKPQLGSHLERYLVDAMRRLVSQNGAWAPNADRSRVWYGRDGLYVVWPQASADMLKLLEADQLPGIPKSPETILEILVDAGVVEPRDASASTWLIYPPETKEPIEAVKLALPDILLIAMVTPQDPLPHVLTKPHAPAADADAGAAKSKKTRPVQLTLDVEPNHSAAADNPERVAEPLPESTPIALSDVSLSDAIDHPVDLQQGSAPGATEFALSPHPRLNPALAAALADIVSTLNGKAKLACCTVAQGLFVPLFEFESRGIDTAIAIRSLSELSMLAAPRSEKIKTVSTNFGGEQKIGVVIAPQFISGLNPADFVAPSTDKEAPHART